MHPVNSTLSQLEIGSPQSYRGLSIFPLTSSANGSTDYLLLSEALEAGLVSVRESSHGGSVPDLVVENRADRPVLIVDGEELLGAKQNRVANLTLLVPAAKSTTIPVSCVEAGRWAYRSDEFALSERVHFARGRREKLASVQASMLSTGSRYSDQGAVWDTIENKAEAMDAPSPTSAMGSVFEKHAKSLDEFVNRLPAGPNQVGGAFAVAGAVYGLDVFDKATTFATMLPKLVRSYGIDALELGSDTESAPSAGGVRKFLAHLGKGKIEEHNAVGLGQDIRIEAPEVIAGGLVVDSGLIHLAAFANTDQLHPSLSPSRRFASYRQRRRSARQRS